jgi:hypothetical protein
MEFWINILKGRLYFKTIFLSLKYFNFRGNLLIYFLTGQNFPENITGLCEYVPLTGTGHVEVRV